MILSAVFLIGFSTLAFEVLLTRVFSIGQWNHLSFMVISIALFGFASSGTYLSIYNARRSRRNQPYTIRETTVILVALYSATTISAFIALNRMPLDYFRLPLEPIQSVYLLMAFILLALPFFFSGLIVAVAYTGLPEKTGLIYFATMSGSAVGALFPGLLLPFFSEGRLVVFCALIPLILIPLSIGRLQTTQTTAAGTGARSIRPALAFFSAGMVLAAVYLMSPHGDRLIRVNPSPYKALSQALQFPDTRIKQTINNIRGRTDRVTSPYIRFAPGLSLRYPESISIQEATFKDGDNLLVLYPSGSGDRTPFATHTLAYSGYALRPDAQKALVVLRGGGTAIPCARAAKIPEVRIVVENPSLADVLSGHYGVQVDSRAPRAFISQTREHFDIIHVEDWGTSIPGSAALDQNPLYTIDAFRQYLQRLTPDGVVIMPRRLLLPPADCLRLWASACESLRQTGARNPADHLAVLRNWDTFALLVFKQPLASTRALEEFAENLNFDLVFLPRMTSDQANRYNKFDSPYHFIEIDRLASAYREGRETAYFGSYLLDVVPQTDNRPFPGRYLKWPKVKSLYQTLGSRLYALLMSGEIVVLVVLIEALAISGFLLFLPLVLVGRRRKKPTPAQASYFFGVGAGFMFIELFFIKAYILLFGDPVISFSVVVAGILIFSSFGGAWAQKRDPSILKRALPILIAVLLLAFILLDPLVVYLLGLAEIWQYGGALLILLPIGFLMGLPFTIGMRDLLSSADERAYAWSANGCASVVMSIVSAQIALMFGVSYILGCGIAAYVVVILSWRRIRSV